MRLTWQGCCWGALNLTTGGARRRCCSCTRVHHLVLRQLCCRCGCFTPCTGAQYAQCAAHLQLQLALALGHKLGLLLLLQALQLPLVQPAHARGSLSVTCCSPGSILTACMCPYPILKPVRYTDIVGTPASHMQSTPGRPDLLLAALFLSIRQAPAHSRCAEAPVELGAPDEVALIVEDGRLGGQADRQHSSAQIQQRHACMPG